jgi:hypothetical protein
VQWKAQLTNQEILTIQIATLQNPKCLMPNGKKVLTKICGSRNADTERAFTGKLWDSEAKGTYYYWHGNKLFKSVKVR